MPDFLALADTWDGGEAAAVAHVTGCQGQRCPTCAVIACAADLRALATECRP